MFKEPLRVSWSSKFIHILYQKYSLFFDLRAYINSLLEMLLYHPVIVSKLKANLGYHKDTLTTQKKSLKFNFVARFRMSTTNPSTTLQFLSRKKLLIIVMYKISMKFLSNFLVNGSTLIMTYKPIPPFILTQSYPY